MKGLDKLKSSEGVQIYNSPFSFTWDKQNYPNNLNFRHEYIQMNIYVRCICVCVSMSMYQ